MPIYICENCGNECEVIERTHKFHDDARGLKTVIEETYITSNCCYDNVREKNGDT